MAKSLNISTTLSSHRIRCTLLVCTASFLGACSVGSDNASIWAVAKGLWSGGKSVSLTEAAAVPYASLGLRIGGSSELMLILAADESGEELWTSAARIAISTKNGRIVRTSGLGHDLGAHDLSDYTQRSQAPSQSDPSVVHWQADYPELGLYSVSIVCEDNQAGEETIIILGKSIRTRRVDEHCSAERSQLDWSFRNTYWIDPQSGLVWRSKQHVNPKLDVIELETLRPPA